MKAKTNGIELNYEIHGDKGPWVVLSHSLACHLHMWDAQIDLLKDRFRVLAFDTRGHGQSDAPAGAYTLDQLVEDARGLLSGVGVEKPHWVGLSMGGMETKTITLRNLDKFSHIGLFSGGTISPDDIADMTAFKDSNKLVFVSYGSREVSGDRPRRGGDPKVEVDALKEAGINSHYYISPETAHEWQTWRRSLHEFAPMLFNN